MTEFKERIAKARDARIFIEDHGIPTWTIGLDYGGSAQSAGLYDLRHRNAGKLMQAVMRAFDTDDWSKIPGRYIIALCDDDYSGMVRGFKPMPTEKGRQVIFADVLAAE